MAIVVESQNTSSVATSNRAPEPYIDVIAPRNIATPTETSAGAQTDSVKLSLSAQIHLLKNRGISDKQIAIALDVDTATVASYLGRSTASAASSPTVTATK